MPDVRELKDEELENVNGGVNFQIVVVILTMVIT